MALYMSICNFSLTMSGQVFLKFWRVGKSSGITWALSVSSNLRPIKSSCTGNQMSIFTKLFPSYIPASFSFIFLFPFLSSLFFDPLLPSIPFAPHFLMPNNQSPVCTFSERRDSVMEKGPQTKAVLQDRALWRIGGWWLGPSLRASAQVWTLNRKKH